jgi:3-deoxy-D-manno-octulosonic-acid transferase
VGEVSGAVATLYRVRQRFPDAFLCLTVATPLGFQFAHRQLGDVATIVPSPLDFPWSVRRAVRTLRPDVYIAFESEFWPNLFALLRRHAIPALLLNGRISQQSACRYQRLQSLYRPIFEHFHHLAMHSREDGDRAVALGAPPARVEVLGSAKYDGLMARAARTDLRRWRHLLRLDAGSPIVVGGSLRRSECLQLLEVFRRLRVDEPRLVGIFAPRHLERLPAMAEALEATGTGFQRLSQITEGGALRTAPVILVDRMGMLFELYGLGNLVFCGGTLEPIGGHNILEPAAWGVAVFYGPHVERVQAEHSTLADVGAGIMVRDGEDLCTQWRHELQDLPALAVRGRNGREALQRLTGAAAAHVEIIAGVLSHAEYTSRVRRGGH